MGILYPVFGFMIISYPLSLEIRELEHWRGMGFRDLRGSWGVGMVPDWLGWLEFRVCQLSVLLQSSLGFRSFVVLEGNIYLLACP